MEPIILGIETSCDETSVALLKGKHEILSDIIISQIDIHKIFGGVVPEVASRKHIDFLYKITKEVFQKANIKYDDIDAIAVTYGPGLVGSLLMGLNFAKSLSFSLNKPLIGVNHLMGHIYANFLAFKDLKPPFIVLLVSGGHTMIIHAKDYMDFEIIGKTRDDAAGEAFDKVSKMMNTGYPGGPVIDRLAKMGKNIYKFPKPLYNNGYDFSFSGLKTSVLYFLKEHSQANIEDIACSFQESLIDTLVHKVVKYSNDSGVKKIVIAGGVAANSLLRSKFDGIKNINIYYPNLKYCTDNAAMIARAGYEKFIRNQFSDLNLDAIPNLGLKEL